jgi:hypothetical protein
MHNLIYKNMAQRGKVIGWIQLIGGIVALWSTWSGNYIIGIGIIGLVLLATGYDHVSGQHR